MVFDRALALVLAASGVGCLAAAVRSIFLRIASRGWVTTPGIIALSRLRTERDSDGGEGHWAEVQYRYQVAGVEYVGKNLQFGRVAGSKKSIEETVVRFPEGSAATVWHDPGSPSRSTLERRVSGVAIVLLLLGIGLLTISWLVWSRV